MTIPLQCASLYDGQEYCWGYRFFTVACCSYCFCCCGSCEYCCSDFFSIVAVAASCSVAALASIGHHHHHHHHHHLHLNREGRWGSTDDFTTSFFLFSLFSTALWDLANAKPVHSLMLSSHLFLRLPCLLPPFTVPCKMVLARPDQREA